MTTKILLKPSEKLTNFSLTAVIEQKTDGKYQAIILGLPDRRDFERVPGLRFEDWTI
jgi:hypothetical protein